MDNFRYQQTAFGGIREDVGDTYHARDSLNMLTDYGRVRKRHGYRQTLSFEGAVRWVGDVALSGKEYRLIYAGARFYLRDADDPDEQAYYRDVTLSGTRHTVLPDRLLDRAIQVYQQSGKAYVVGAGDYLVLSLIDGRPQLRRVEDEEHTYVPTTRIGITADSAATYVEQTPDEEEGDWWILQDGVYQEVHLDSQNPPEVGVTYYRRVATYSAGRELDRPNLLSTYRINTLFGCEQASSTYRLDVPSIDPDGKVEVKIRALRGEQVRSYTLTSYAQATEERALVKGDDLTGKTLLVHQGTGTSSSLHLIPAKVGMAAVTFERGMIVWEADGVTSTAWNDARLVVHTPLGNTTIATAHRSSWTSPYTVTIVDAQVPMGDIGSVTALGWDMGDRLSAVLPRLTGDLRSGNTVKGSVDFRTGKLTIDMDTTPPDSFDNITVKFRYRPTEYTADLINLSARSVVWGIDGRQDRLFVADPTKGADYHSASGDMTYFADTDYTALGSGKVIGYLPVNDNTLATFTDEEYGHNLFVRKGSWSEQTITVGDVANTTYTALFPIVGSWRVRSPYPVGFGEIGGQKVFATPEGVYSLVYNSQYQEGKSRLKGKVDISSPLCARSHDGKYYLSTGNGVWVLDSRLTYGDKGDEVFELSRLGIEGVSCWFESRGQLGFGTLDGRVCVVDEGFADVTFKPLLAGDLTLDGEGGAVVSQEIEPPLGSKLYLDCDAYYPLAQGEMAGGVCYLPADGVDSVYEGQTVYLGEGRTPATVAEIDWAKCAVTFAEESEYPQGSITLWGNAQGVPLDWTREGNYLTLTRKDGFSVKLTSLEGVATGKWVSTFPVVAYWESQSLAIGKGEQNKLLTRLSATFLSAIRGGAEVVVSNGSSLERFALRGVGKLDYGDLAFDRATFEGTKWQSHVKRLKMRFHHLWYRVVSDTDGAWELGSVVLSGIVPDKQRGGVNG